MGSWADIMDADDAVVEKAVGLGAATFGGSQRAAYGADIVGDAVHMPSGCLGANLPPHPEAVYTAIAQVGAVEGHDLPGALGAPPSVAHLGHLGLAGTHPPAPRVLYLHLLAATGLQAAPMAALPGHLGLVGMHPPAPTAPFKKFLAATGLQVAPLVALLGHLGLAGIRPRAPRVLDLHSLAATRLQVALMAALSGHLGLEGVCPPAPRVPLANSLAATKLRVAPLVALSGHPRLAGIRPPMPRVLHLHLQLRAPERGGDSDQQPLPPQFGVLQEEEGCTRKCIQEQKSCKRQC